MASYSQLPGSLNMYVKGGDHFATVIDFDADLNGTFAYASVHSLVNNEQITELTVSYLDPTLGKIGLSLSGTQTGLIPAGSYAWSMHLIPESGQKRSPLAGVFEVA